MLLPHAASCPLPNTPLRHTHTSLFPPPLFFSTLPAFAGPSASPTCASRTALLHRRGYLCEESWTGESRVAAAAASLKLTLLQLLWLDA